MQNLPTHIFVEHKLNYIQSVKQTAQSQPSIIVWLHPLNKFDDVFITEADTQTNTFSQTFIWAHVVYMVATIIC